LNFSIIKLGLKSVDPFVLAGIPLALLGLACVVTLADGSATSWSLANTVIKKSSTKEVLAFLVWSSLFSPIPLFLIAWIEHGAAAYVQTFARIDGRAMFAILFQA